MIKRDDIVPAAATFPLAVTRDGGLTDSAGRRFDLARHRWTAGSSGLPLDAQVLSAQDALTRALAAGGRRLPIGVVGPHAATLEQAETARAVGRAIGAIGLPLVCGGRGGAMEAASQGAAEAGGLVIGILPSSDWHSANPHVTIPIATGLGEARNAIISSACFALIAVGPGHGTLSEMALGLKLGRTVIAMPGAYAVDGATACSDVDAAMDLVAVAYFGASQ